MYRHVDIHVFLGHMDATLHEAPIFSGLCGLELWPKINCAMDLVSLWKSLNLAEEMLSLLRSLLRLTLCLRLTGTCCGDSLDLSLNSQPTQMEITALLFLTWAVGSWAQFYAGEGLDWQWAPIPELLVAGQGEQEKAFFVGEQWWARPGCSVVEQRGWMERVPMCI